MSDTARNGIDKTALSYWYPKLVEAGIPVPRTKIVKMPIEAQKVIWGWFDGKEGDGAEKPFFAELRSAMQDMGFPCFLRTERPTTLVLHLLWKRDRVVIRHRREFPMGI